MGTGELSLSLSMPRLLFWLGCWAVLGYWAGYAELARLLSWLVLGRWADYININHTIFPDALRG